MKASLITRLTMLLCILSADFAHAITTDELSRASELIDKNGIMLSENMKINSIRKWQDQTLVGVVQYYKGLPIINSDLIYKFDENGKALVDKSGKIEVLGHFMFSIHNIDIDIHPAITEHEAIEIFRKNAAKDRPSGSPIAILSISNIKGGNSFAEPLYRLIWRVTTASAEYPHIILDAETGQVYIYTNGIKY